MQIRTGSKWFSEEQQLQVAGAQQHPLKEQRNSRQKNPFQKRGNTIEIRNRNHKGQTGRTDEEIALRGGGLLITIHPSEYG
jgi:hypothetical protein